MKKPELDRRVRIRFDVESKNWKAFIERRGVVARFYFDRSTNLSELLERVKSRRGK